MKLRPFILSSLTVSIGLLGCFRAEAAPTFQVVATFDYPGQPQGALFGTYPLGISDAGVIAGQVFMSDFSHHGFKRYADGTFSDLINEPNDHAGYYTELTGINLSSVASGFYQKDDGFFTSFLLDNGVYSEFAVAGAIATYINGLNNANDFCGWSGNGSAITGFISLAGVVTSFQVPDPTGIKTFANGLNNLNQCVGSYQTGFGNYGFLRDANGSFVYPFNVPQATTTSLNGINDRGLMVGSYQDRTGTHGVLYMPNRRFATYDYPGSNATTVFSGINKSGLICGYYSDSAGIHGFVVRTKANTGN